MQRDCLSTGFCKAGMHGGSWCKDRADFKNSFPSPQGETMAARYTLIVGTRSWSSWSLRPYMALRHIGQPFETILVRLRRAEESRQEILKYSPSGKVPLLKIGEDETIWDSLAICETLAERHPQAGLLPADPKLRALARSYCAEMHSGFPDVRDQLTM